MLAEDIQRRLQDLSPEIPWAHLFEFAPGVVSVTPHNEQFHKKAIGLRRIGDLLLDISRAEVRGHTLTGKRVLDLGCGEGGHSIQFAKDGSSVLGIEGRSLYLARARFAAEATGTPNIRFEQGDVRRLASNIEPFDIVLASGILHHLGVDDFDDMVETLGKQTADLLLIYLHISTDLSVKNHRLKGPVKTRGGREGHLFREHQDNATPQEKVQQVRASLDNTFSFWPREEALIEALCSVGFHLVLKVLAPHVFGWEGASYRPILLAKKRPPL